MNTKAVLDRVRADESMALLSARIPKSTMSHLEQIAELEGRPVAAIARAILEVYAREVLDVLLHDDQRAE